MLLGAGCSCGLPAGHIDVSTIDTMIGLYLADKYQTTGREKLATLLNRAKKNGLASVISDLIEGLAVVSDEDAAAFCDDLEVSVSSLEEASGGSLGRRPRIETL